MKKELLKRILGGLGSLFKDRGKYFDPTSQNFGEVSTLLKGAPKNKIATDKQLLEAEVMQRMMADPKYTGFRKSVLGETAEDDALENLQTMILGKDPAVINPDSARGRKMMREMQFFPKQKEGITSAKAVEEESDRILKAMRDMESQSKNMLTESTFLLDEQKLKNEAVDMFMREIEDGFEPTAALERMIRKIKLARTKQADGGRVGMKLGGLSSKGLNYLLDPKLRQDIKELLLMRPKANMGMDPAKSADMQQAVNVIRDPRTDLERILKDRADGTKATPLDTMTIRELEQMVQDSPRYTDKQKAVFFKLIDKEKIRANHFYNTGQELSDDMLEMLYREGEGDFNQGGRVGMFAGGSLIGKGIMEAAKLAKRGVKPFGAKQTYKQNVTMKGVSDDQFDEIFKKELAKVPDEVVDQETASGLNQSLREAEAIITGQKLGLLSQPQRTKIATAMTKKVSKQIYGDNSRFSNDYLEYMDDVVGRMEDILKIERLGGDLTPKPILDGTEIIGAEIDFGQLTNLIKKQRKESSLDLIKKGIDKGQINVVNPKSADIIPFKPKTKKANGGTVPPLKGPASDGMGSLFRRK